MARIISTDREIFNWEFTCRKCASVIEADSSDLRLMRFHGGGGLKIVVYCPVCGEISCPPLNNHQDQIDLYNAARRNTGGELPYVMGNWLDFVA